MEERCVHDGCEIRIEGGRDAHNRIYHQDSYETTHPLTGQRIKVIRNPMTLKYHCPCGVYENINAELARKHLRRCKLGLARLPRNRDQIIVQDALDDEDGEDADSVGQNEPMRSGERILGGGSDVESIVYSEEEVITREECHNDTENDTSRKNALLPQELLEYKARQYALGVKYLPEFEVLLCLECEYGIPPDIGVWSHLSRFHKLPSHRREEVETLFGNLKLKKPSEVVLPPPGGPAVGCLNVMDGYLCNRCPYAAGKEDTISRHCREHPNLSSATFCSSTSSSKKPLPYKKSKVQSFFEVTGKRYFSVLVKSECEGPGDLEERQNAILETEIEKFVHYRELLDDGVVNQTLLSSDLSPWLKRVGWAEHLKGQNLCRLRKLIDLPKTRDNDPIMKMVAEAVDRVLEKSVMLFRRRTSVWIRRWMASVSGTDAEPQPFSLVSDETWVGYKLLWKQLFVYFSRILLSRPVASTGSGEISLPTETASRDARGTNLDANPDIMELLQLTTVQKQSFEKLAHMLRTCSSAEDLEDVIFEFSSALVEHEFDDDDSNSSPLMHFISVLGISNRSFTFKQANNVSGDLAGLLYNCRMILLRKAHNTAEAYATSKYQRFKDLHNQYLVASNPTPVGELLNLLAFAKGIGTTESGRPMVIWSHESEDTLFLQGDPINVQSFRELVARMILEAKNILLEKIGITENFLQKLAEAKIKDNVSRTDAGYSFLEDPSNSHLFDAGSGAGGTKMLRNIWENPVLKKMLLRVVENRIIWLPGGFGRLKQAVEDFLERLLLIFHFLGGQPARGTEITQIRFANTIFGPREVYLLDSIVFFLISYHKSQNMTGFSKFIARFLPKEPSVLYIVYVGYVKPLVEYVESRISEGVSGPVSARRYLLFTSEGSKPWNTPRVTKILERETRKQFGVAVGISGYRHIAVAMSRKYMRIPFQFDEQADQDDINDLQAGHSTDVANRIYAVNSDIIRSFTDQTIEQFGRISRAWHDFLLKDKSTVSAKQSSLSKRIASSELDPKLISPKKPRGTDQLRPSTPIIVDGQAPYQNDRTGGQSWQLSQRRPINFQGNGENLGSELSMGQTNTMKGLIHDLLVRVIGPGAIFKSPEQKEALMWVISGRTPLVVILPTSGGKSLLFWAPSCMRRAGITVVLVPFLALMFDLERRARAAAIPYQVWDAESPVLYKPLVFITVEAAANGSFRHQVRAVREANRLERIIVDEAHLLVTDIGFRKSFGKISWFTSLDVQQVFLTATLPPFMEPAFEDTAKILHPKYIRVSGNRSNIRYRVVVCKDAFGEALKEIDKRNLEEEDRVIVYAPYVNTCDSFSEYANCAKYYANCEDNTESLRDWMSKTGEHKTIVATSALGAGIDLPTVRKVIHLGSPWSLIEFAQASGRCGRDGKESESIVIIQSQQAFSGTGGVDDGVANYLRTSACRRKILTAFLDGGEGRLCTGGDIKCDNCDTVAPESSLSSSVRLRSSPLSPTAKWSTSRESAYSFSSSADFHSRLSRRATGVSHKHDSRLSTSSVYNKPCSESYRSPASHTLPSSEPKLREVINTPLRSVLSHQMLSSSPSGLIPLSGGERYRQNQMADAESWQLMRNCLDMLSRVCGLCWARSTPENVYPFDHPLDSCRVHEDIQATYEEYIKWKHNIRFGKYIACYRCYAPQILCQNFFGSEGICRYHGILPAVAFMAVCLTRLEKAVRSLVGRTNPKSLDYEDWLTKEIADHHGQKSHNMMAVFEAVMKANDQSGQ